MKKRRADMPVRVVIALLGCTIVLLCGMELQERAKLAPPAEFIYWEPSVSAASAERAAAPVSSSGETASAETSQPLPDEARDIPGGEAASPPPPQPEPAPPESAPPKPQAAAVPESAPVKIYLDAPEDGPTSEDGEFFSEEASSEPEETEEVDFQEEAPGQESSKASSREQFDPNGVVNLNTAGAAELQSLKGIGEVLAARIIEYRERTGGFRSIEEIMNVKGIAEGKFAAIRDRITV